MSIRKLFITLLFMFFALILAFNFLRHLSVMIPFKSKHGVLQAEKPTPIAIPKIVRLSAICIMGCIDGYSIVKQIFKVSRSGTIDGIMLIIDSNGGNIGPSEIIAEAVAHASKHKPLISFVPGYALSGGYLIAASAPYIIAAPSSLIGSIGTCITISPRGKDKQRPMEFSSEHFKFSRYDKEDNMLPEHITFNNEIAAAMSMQFRKQVTERRPALTDQELIDMQAKYFTGIDSLKYKLIDSTGLLKDAIAVLYRKIGNPSCDYVELVNDQDETIAIFTSQELLHQAEQQHNT